MNDQHEAAINIIHPTLDLKFVAETALLDIHVRIYRSAATGDNTHFYTIGMAKSPAITLYPLASMFALSKALDQLGNQMTVFSEAGAPPEDEAEAPEAEDEVEASDE